MRVSCPACHAEYSLEVLLQHEAARAAMARLARISLPFGALLLQYIGLFRPAKRRLSIDRMVALIDEVLPDIERGAINRKGRDWPASREAWQAAVEKVLAARDAGRLRLPLTTHAYLYEVLLDQADKVEATAEREEEASRRNKAGAAAEPMPLSDVAQRAVVMASTAPPPPAGPSLYARKVRAEIDARLGRAQPTEGGSDGTQA